MEDFDSRWLQVQEMLRERFGKLPDMEGILFLIGVNELGGMAPKKLTKEQKQDLMHVAVCTLLSQLGYYTYTGHDDDGWPHFAALMEAPIKGVKEQERALQECIVRYFEA